MHAYKVEVFPLPVGPVINTMPWGMGGEVLDDRKALGAESELF